MNFNPKDMAAPTRWEQQHAATEKKKNLANKLLERRTGSAKPIAPPERTLPTANGHELQPKNPTPRSVFNAARVGLPLLRDNGRGPVKVSSTVELLAGHLKSAQSGSTEIVMLWPGSLKGLSLAHAVATMSLWQEGNKRGLRTLLYPAKSNFLQHLNDVQVSRAELGALAMRLYEDPDKPPNVSVTNPLREKDAFLGSVMSIRCTPEEPIHPTVGELLPHFYSDQLFTAWKASEGDLLRHVKVRLGDKHHTQALTRESISVLGAASTAPDALFALGWRTPPGDIEAALRKLKKLGAPKVVMLDATRSIRKSIRNWKSTLVRFLELLGDVWPSDGPAVRIVTDEPHVRTQLLAELAKRNGKGNGTAARLVKEGLHLYGIACAATKDGVYPAALDEPLAPESRTIAVSFTDTHASEVVALVDRLRGSLKDEGWQESLGEASKYLMRLASLPSSTRVLVDWLGEADVAMSVRDSFSWPFYRAKLIQLAENPEFPEKKRLERVILKGNELWKNYENGTPFARKLADLIEEHTRGTERCCVVFTRPTARRLAERYFETYDGYPEGAGFEILKDSVRFVLSNSLDADLGTQGKETVIFAGLDEESLRLLMLDPRISSPTHVLMTRRNAAYLKAVLRAVDGMPELRPLAPRVQEVLKQLPNFPDLDERALLARDDFVLPTFSFEQGLSAAVYGQDDRDPNAWEFVLEGGMTVRRSPTAKAYVYDPLYGHTLTRGFRGVTVGDLNEGQRLFVMSGELREMTEAALKEAGVPISHDKKFEAQLREYHTCIVGLVKAVLPQGTLSDKARLIREQVSNAGVLKDFPEEMAVRSWLDVAKYFEKNFDDSKPQAPRKEAHFKAFAQIIGLSDLQAVYFWKAVIQPLRGTRRVDGRRVSDAYAEMLMEPESAVAHKRMRPEVVAMLFARAKENVYAIEVVKRPEHGRVDE